MDSLSNTEFPPAEETLEMIGGHNLRDRGILRAPDRYRDPPEDSRRQIKELMRKRAGKKTAITGLIDNIGKLIEDYGSRTKIKYLQNDLHVAAEQVTLIHENLMSNLDEDNEEFSDDWIEQINLSISNCNGEIADYFERREGDPPSDNPSIAHCKNWIATGLTDSATPEGDQSDMTERSDDLTVRQLSGLLQNLSVSNTSMERTAQYTQTTHSEGHQAQVHTLNMGGARKRYEPFIGNRFTISHEPTSVHYSVPQDIASTSCYSSAIVSTANKLSQSSHFQTIHSTTDGNLQSYNHSTPFKRFDIPARYISLPQTTMMTESVGNSFSRFNVTMDGRRSENVVSWSNLRPHCISSIGEAATRGHRLPGLTPHFSQSGCYANPLVGNVGPSAERGAVGRLINSNVEAADAWIDNLDPYNDIFTTHEEHSIGSATIQWLSRQDLPRMKVPIFEGSSDTWIEFVVHFKEVVHKRPNLTGTQRMALLLQHVQREAKRCIQVFSMDWYGYTCALKRLKFLFGQRANVAHAHISKAVRGQQIRDDDIEGLVEFYYSIGDCLVTLNRMHYYSDLGSSDVLRQAIRRLPNRLRNKWAEYSLQLRRREEPTLVHLEAWLGDRVMAARDPYLPDQKNRKSFSQNSRNKRDIHDISSLATTMLEESEECEQNNYEISSVNLSTAVDKTAVKKTASKENLCTFCQGTHKLFRCKQFMNKTPGERVSFVRQKELCFNCLAPGHVTKDCVSTFRCSVEECRRHHNTRLHGGFFAKKEPVSEENGQIEVVSTSITLTKNSARHKVYLQVVPVKIITPNGNFAKTYAMLDGGSQSTLIRQDFAESIGLFGLPVNLSIGTITQKGEGMKASQVSFQITSASFKGDIFSVDSAYVIPKTKFHTPSQHLPKNFASDARYSHLHDLGFHNIETDDITILLAADIPQAIIAKEVREGVKGQPIAVKTGLGWTLMGVADEGFAMNYIPGTAVVTTYHNRIELLEEFWSTESFGTKYDLQSPRSTRDLELLKSLSDTTHLSDGHYVVDKLWKETDIKLPNNKSLAERRLQQLFKRFLKQPELYKLYANKLKSYVEEGYARRLTFDEAAEVSQRTWYLPHHPVVSLNKPGKVRPVFDCAAKFHGVSLNDNLETGPDLTNNLAGILLKFRKYKFAIVADIESMFYQVKVGESDRDSLRYLWKENPGQLNPDTYQMLVHIFGGRDSPCCASYALQRTALDHREEFTKEAVDTVLKDFYIDDWLKSVMYEREGILLAKEVMLMLKLGGFNLTKFVSNSQDILDTLPDDNCLKSQMNMDLDGSMVERTLGLKWCLESDNFLFTTISTSKLVTKREILKITSLIFDPLGFLSPFTVKAKALLQDLWRNKYGWDDDIDASLTKRWLDWTEDLKNIVSFSIPRCFILSNQVEKKELHFFSDASEIAFGAVAYMRVIYERGEVKCRLVMSKSRISPIKPLTMPRLELQAAVLSIRLYNFILKELDIKFDSVHYWVDSSLVLQYIYSERKRFKTFVANRVAEIQDSSSSEQWQHIGGKINPADVITRGICIADMGPESTWVNGPEFLWFSKCDLSTRQPIEPVDGSNPELKHEININLSIIEEHFIKALSKFSSWLRTVRVVAWMLRFLFNCQHPMAQRKFQFPNVEEINEAEILLFKMVQKQYYAEEIYTIEHGKIPTNRRLTGLCPFIDPNGVIRVGGRLKNANIPDEAKHQIILPGNSWISELVIRHMHKMHPGMGVEYLVAISRQKYWIINLRPLIKRVLRSCMECKKRNSQPTVPFMADLPKCRLAIGAPTFTYTGVDYFGPFLVKQNRSSVKRWGCLFTCLTTRAIHIELVESLTTDAFINTLERFVNRRGNPNTLISDCGSNFKGADNELKRCLRELNSGNRIEEYMSSRHVNWQFNPPDSPHMGGAWERLVRSIKTSLKIILKERLVTDYQLITILTNVECLVNSRPITPASDDINDLNPLTPNHFLIGRANPNLPRGVVYDADKCSRKRWRQVQYLTNHFWRRWLKEYLPTLTIRSKWRDHVRNIKLGDLVLIEDNSVQRGKWRMGRISSLHPGNDSVVRVAEVTTASGTLMRPVAKLHLLEEQ